MPSCGVSPASIPWRDVGLADALHSGGSQETEASCSDMGQQTELQSLAV